MHYYNNNNNYYYYYYFKKCILLYNSKIFLSQFLWPTLILAFLCVYDMTVVFLNSLNTLKTLQASCALEFVKPCVCAILSHRVTHDMQDSYFNSSLFLRFNIHRHKSMSQFDCFFLQLLTYLWFIYPKLLWHSNLYSKFHFETFCTSQKSYRPISRTPWLWVVDPNLRTPVVDNLEIVDTLWSQYVFLILTVCWDSVSTQSLWVTLSSIKTSWNQDHIWGKLMSNWHHYRSIKRHRIYSYLVHVDLTVAPDRIANRFPEEKKKKPYRFVMTWRFVNDKLWIFNLCKWY